MNALEYNVATVTLWPPQLSPSEKGTRARSAAAQQLLHIPLRSTPSGSRSLRLPSASSARCAHPGADTSSTVSGLGRRFRLVPVFRVKDITLQPRETPTSPYESSTRRNFGPLLHTFSRFFFQEDVEVYSRMYVGCIAFLLWIQVISSPHMYWWRCCCTDAGIVTEAWGETLSG